MLPRMRARYFLLCMLIAGGVAAANGQFPPAEKVFLYSVDADAHRLTVHWDVLPGYYLYRNRLAVTTTTAGVVLGTPDLPKGELHQDEYFGDQEIYRDDFDVVVPIAQIEPKTQRIAIKLQLQGCADAGLCYPPATWQVEVAVQQSVSQTKQ